MGVFADQQTWTLTFLFPFMPVLCVFLVSFVMLGDLPWEDDDDEEDSYEFVPRGRTKGKGKGKKKTKAKRRGTRKSEDGGRQR